MKRKHRIKGTFRANEKGYGFLEQEKEGLEDIFIPAKSTKGALNGDVVYCTIIKQKEGNRKAEGKVVEILERQKDTVVGIFQRSRNFGFVVPDDKRFGSDVFISKSKTLNAKDKDKVIAKITKYPEKGKNAEGEIIEIIGGVNEAGVDMLSLVKEFELPYEFPEEVLEEAKAIPQKIDENEIKNRLDLRDEIIFTIDGEDAKDLDDAIGVYKKDNGNYELDVHIADVSHYVTEGSNLNREAIRRGTSVYMLDRVIPMLPVELSNGICSLNAGEDRLALSCLMEIDNDGKVVNSDIRKTVVKVCERMNYTDVNKIITDSDPEVIKKYEKYVDHFKLMEKIARILKDRRLKAGYLNLDIPESKITLDENGHTIDVGPYQSTFANEIIEQFMLTANESVAEKYFWMQYPIIYRVHEEPDYDKILETNKFLFNLGKSIKVSRNNIYPKAFAEVLDEIKGTEYEKVISTLVLRTLKVAKYEAENKGHFGIASKYYCHFTSPIRRYPDLFTHRVISIYADKIAKGKEDEMQKQAEDYALTSSERERIAVQAEREAEDIKKAEYMEDRIGEEYTGIISSITSFGMFVELPNTIEGLIRFDHFNSPEYFTYNEDFKSLVGEKTGKTYKTGDYVRIRVLEASKLLRKISFEIAPEEDNESNKNLDNETIEK